MDKDKLADLRRRYADAKGGALYDPEFKRVSQTQFQGDRRKWPFMEPATFLSAPHRPNAAAESFADLDVALVGVPMDLGVTNRAGARLGPRAVRAVERIGPYEHVLKCVPLGEARIADIGDVPMRSRFSLDKLPCRHREPFRRHRAPPACARSRSAATTRSACRSSRRWAATGRSA